MELMSTKAISRKYKSTKTCVLCEGTGRYNNNKCLECQNGEIRVEVDVDELINFLNTEIGTAKVTLRHASELDENLRRWAIGKSESYEYLLSVIFSNKLK